MSKFKSHQRVNDIFFGPLERPALRWLAAHMPAWMTPDILTMIGVIGSVVSMGGYLLGRINHLGLWLASLGLVVNWFGDSLDGSLARYRNIERPKYGFFIDRSLDAMGEFLVLIGLGLSPYCRFDIACLALIGYFMMEILVIAATHSHGVFKISYGKIGPTELRVVIILTNTVVYFLGNPGIQTTKGIFHLFDLILIPLTAAILLVFVFSTVRLARELKDIDRQDN